jgi:hypothetical protein
MQIIDLQGSCKQYSNSVIVSASVGKKDELSSGNKPDTIQDYTL